MKFGRRWLLVHLPLVSLFASTLSKAAVVTGPKPVFAPPDSAVEGSDDEDLDPLPFYLDTLIPKDDFPGATELGVDRKLREQAENTPGYPELLAKGAKWLNDEANRGAGVEFHALTPAQRDFIVEFASNTEPGTLPRIFFDRTRYDAMRLYYSDARSWPGLNYAGPPQPLGFMDHAEPPLAVKL